MPLNEAYSVQEPFADYITGEGVNCSRLKLMSWSPAHYNAFRDRTDTDALRMGRLVHLCVLENELFRERTTVWQGGMTKATKAKPARPTMNKQSLAYKEFAAECAANGVEVIDESDLRLCENIHRAVRTHPMASMYLSEGEAELSIYWTHPFGPKCKSRIDFLGETICDLKTVRDLRSHKFGRSCHDYQYHVQAAFYQDAVEQLTGEKRPYMIIGVEKFSPFDVVCFRMPDEALALGRQIYTEWLRKVIECDASGHWPGICDTEDVVELPSYAYTDLDDGKAFIDGVEVAI